MTIEEKEITDLTTLTTDELIDRLDYCGYDPYYDSIRNSVIKEIKKRLDNIVRCKDCKHGRIFNGRNKKLVACENVDHPCFDLDWFCADGVKR